MRLAHRQSRRARCVVAASLDDLGGRLARQQAGTMSPKTAHSNAPHVIFVAPFFLEATVRFVRAVASLPGVNVTLIHQDSRERLDGDVKRMLHDAVAIPNALDAQQIADAVRVLVGRHGPCHRLLATLEQLQEPVAEVRRALGISGHGPQTATNFRDKGRMKEVLGAAGLPVARHAKVTTLEAARAFVAKVGLPVVVKPPAGAGSVATWRCDTDDALVAAVTAAHVSAARPVQVEEFVQGLERSFEVISIAGRPLFSSLCWYDPRPLEVLQQPWVQWTVTLPREINDPAYDDVRRVGFAALKALGMQTGISHMEWFRKHDGAVMINEIAARPPGANIIRLNSLAFERDFFDTWADVVVNERLDPPEQHWAAGAAFLRGQGKIGGRVMRIHGLDDAQKQIGRYVVDSRLPALGTPQSSSYEGEGWVLVRARTTEEVQSALRVIIGTVRVELG
jgi:biotin carboxylase